MATILVVVDDSGEEVRYRLLESIREYARLRLQTCEQQCQGLKTEQWRWCIGLAERAEPELTGPDQAEWLERLERESDNVCVALDFASESVDGNASVRLANGMWRFWETRGYFGEGFDRLKCALALGMRRNRS